MTFSEADLDSLRRGRQEIHERYERLLLGFVNRHFENQRAKEFATHGFVRRLKTLQRCIDNVFEVMPPDRTDLPASEELSDAAIYIQAFVTNVFGITDNLAWVWVHETGLRREDGRALSRSSVGLRPGFDIVLRSLSPEFREYILTLEDWFEYLESFRHSLAHRIPLYIPPYNIRPDQLAVYRELGEQMEVAYNNRDFNEYERLEEEQSVLKEFRPYMTHSLAEEPNPALFHPQMIADFNTVYELGRRMLDELDQ